jgi:Carbohydrate esterase, sialic acid-specific acetylesterase
MKFFIPLFLLISFHSFAQFTITESPKDLQLFPRNSANQASVFVKGQVTSGLVQKMSLLVKKDGILFQYHHQNISVSSPLPVSYDFSSTIYAISVEYSFKLYCHFSPTDSIEVMNRNRVVCGDVYVLYGQSNIVAQAGIDDENIETDDRLLRNFDFGNNYNPNTLQWFPAKQPYAQVGVVGLKLQKQILAQTGIPTCIINGASGGLSITQLNIRNGANPTDLTTYYGRLLARVQAAGAVGKIKGIIWRQGEAESCTWYVDVNNYPANFSILYNNLHQDLGVFDYFYNIQTGIYPCSFNGGGTLREFQRKTKYLYPKIRTTNCMGIESPDVLHHTRAGYGQMVSEIFQQISHDIYNSPDSIEITSPDIQKIIKKASNDTLVLVFGNDQKIIYPNDTTINGTLWQLKNYFYLNHSNYVVQNAWAVGNRVFLKLNQSFNTGTMNYLPANFTPRYLGPHLKNSKGLRAFSFQDFPVVPQLSPKPSIDSIIKITGDKLRIYFALPVAGMKILVERKLNQATGYEYVGTTVNNFFEDIRTLIRGDSVTYRILLVSTTSESDFSTSKQYIFPACNAQNLTGQATQSNIYLGRTITSTQHIMSQKRYGFSEYTDLLPNFKTDANVFFEVIKGGCDN